MALTKDSSRAEDSSRAQDSSRRHRANQTILNLSLSLAASLLIVIFLVVVVVRPDSSGAGTVDFQKLAAEAQTEVSEPLASPKLPATWTANSAELETGRDGIQSWYIGLLTPSEQFIGLSQGIDANATWVANQLGERSSTGDANIGGVSWATYDYRTGKDSGNLAYAMSAQIGHSDVVLFGTAVESEFETLARAIADNLLTTEGAAP
jgi:Protein of unknown function (DUF4245)